MHQEVVMQDSRVRYSALFDSTIAWTREYERQGTISCDDLFACYLLFFVENSDSNGWRNVCDRIC